LKKICVAFLVLATLSACSTIPLFSGKDYYRRVETKVGNQRVGENQRESRELFCPAGRLGEADDPGAWSDVEVQQKLNDKVCLKVICRTDRVGSVHCVDSGDASLKPKLVRLRDDPAGVASTPKK
jgi:hypothetical protein